MDPAVSGREAPPPSPWHAVAAEEVLARLGGRPEGLSAAEVAERRARFGANTLRRVRPTPWWRILLAQVRSVVVGLLVAAAALSLAIGDPLDAAAIGVVLLLNVGIGFWTERGARRAMESLARLQVGRAVVRRGGVERDVEARELVPGDVLVLDEGAAVPADARLLEATDLRLVEAPLTGESFPVDKRVEPVPPDTPLADRTPMVFKGTLVAAGRGVAAVTATGTATEIGRISELVQETEEETTPLERRLDALGRRLVGVTLGVAAAVALVGIARGVPIGLMLETAIALAIAAVPEGLPVVATITLAVGMARMARRRALVRHLPAVESLGSTTVICTDKTGTLTGGEMTVTALRAGGLEVAVTGRGYGPAGDLRVADAPLDEVPPVVCRALRAAVLANRARLAPVDGRVEAQGDPTEAALLVVGAKAGLDRERLRHELPEVGEVPFSSGRKLMATFHESPDGVLAVVKGAPDRLLAIAGHECDADGRPRALSEDRRQRWQTANDRLARRGLRVLALAERWLPAGTNPGPEALQDLTLLGLVGMIDPPAEGVEETIARLLRAGVRTVMITGDQRGTAEAIAERLGLLLAGGETLDGAEVAALSDAELAQRVERVVAFSRVTAEDKLRIVDAFQARGEIVGMLGDGVNDAPALKSADIGVAMGIRGTDVAKETADIVLADDRFETIGAAMEEGRVVFDNIRRAVLFLFSCNLAEILVLFAATVAGLPLPLLPLQLLWLNLITDVLPALALAREPAEPDVMDRPPRRPDRGILSRGFTVLVSGYAVVLTAATLGVFLWALLVRRLPVDEVRTATFLALALSQLAHALNARSRGPVLVRGRLLGNPWMWGALALTGLLQAAAVGWQPLASVLGTVPLRPEAWTAVAVAALLPLAAGELWKRRPGARSRTAGGNETRPGA